MRLRAALLLLAIALPLVPSALGHAEPFEASPGWNERLDASPSEAVVSFTEPVHAEGSWIRVQDLQGNRVDNDNLEITFGPRPVMRVTLPELPDGGYLIRWQTFSQTDGHTIGGAIGFSIGGFAPPQSTTIDDDARAGGVIGRALAYLGYVVAIGAFAFQVAVLRRHPDATLDRPLLLAAAVHLLGVVALLLDTAAGTGIGLGAFLSGPGGRALAVRAFIGFLLLALTALWSFGPVRPRFRYHLLAAGWLAAVALGARLGHAEGAASWLVQTVHGVSIAAWVGALGFLVHWLWRDRDGDVQDVGRRFGTLGVAATALMAATGIYLSAVILGPAFLDAGAAFANPWRSILTWKILLAAAMIGIAVVNRFVLLGDAGARLRQALGGRRDGLRRLAAVETAVGLVVIGLAGGLMSLAAPSEALQPEESVLERSAEGFDFQGLLRIAPEPVEGQLHTVRLYLEDFAGDPLQENSCAEGRNDCVSLRWYLDADGIDTAQSAVGVPDGDGWWTFENVIFASAGNTTAAVEASSAYAYQDELVFRFPALQSA